MVQPGIIPEQSETWLSGIFNSIVVMFRDLLGVEFEQGTVKTNTVELETGVTIKDQATGAYYCLQMVDGTLRTILGECSAMPGPSSAAPTPVSTPESTPLEIDIPSASESPAPSDIPESTPEPTLEPTPEPTPELTPEPTPETPPPEPPIEDGEI